MDFLLFVHASKIACIKGNIDENFLWHVDLNTAIFFSIWYPWKQNWKADYFDDSHVVNWAEWKNKSHFYFEMENLNFSISRLLNEEDEFEDNLISEDEENGNIFWM